MSVTNCDIKEKIGELYDELFLHDGYGRIEIDLRILRRNQKEVIVRCGKEYRFVIDFPGKSKGGGAKLVASNQSSLLNPVMQCHEE